MRTLILDSSVYPVGIVGWEKAMVLLFTGRAQIVDVYAEIDIRSPSKSFKLPKILRLFARHMARKEVRFTRFNVFHRDDFSCQYCLGRFGMGDLTFDHVVPLSRGGKTCWENIVTCCRACNSQKGSKTLEEAGMKIAKWPGRPRWSPELCFKLKENDPEEWRSWIPLVGHYIT